MKTSSNGSVLARSLFSVELLLAASLLFGCRSTSQGPTGGETHFLRACDRSGSQTCGGDFDCVCGVCTLPCDRQIACGALPAAQCIDISEPHVCAESVLMGHCDVSCDADADCAEISPAHRCESGACRAPASEPLFPVERDASSEASAPLPSDASACSESDISANEVLLMGDSFFASSHQTTGFLEELARDAAVLSPGERYRDKSSVLDNALALSGNGLAAQYDSAVAEAKVRVVVMDGGGADLLLGTCEVNDATCPILVDAAAAAVELLARMAEGDVEHVVYVFYPDPEDAGTKQKVDALRPMIQSACEGSSVPCHWLDLREHFADHYAEYVQADGLFPTSAGSRATAQGIWATMQQACIAQ